MKLLTPNQLTFINEYLSAGVRLKSFIRHAWDVNQSDNPKVGPWSLAMDAYTDAMLRLLLTDEPLDTSVNKNGYEALRHRGE